MNPERGPDQRDPRACSASTGPGWLTDPDLALFSVALVDVWKGVGLATLIYIAGIVSIPQEYFEAAKVDGASAASQLPAHRAAAGPAGHRHGDHPVADRRPALVRPDLGDDPRRPGLHLRRHRVGHLQAVPGRLLRAVDRGQRDPVRRWSPRSCCRCSGSSTARRSTCEHRRRRTARAGAAEELPAQRGRHRGRRSWSSSCRSLFIVAHRGQDPAGGRGARLLLAGAARSSCRTSRR